jgi:hypothetical protein
MGLAVGTGAVAIREAGIRPTTLKRAFSVAIALVVMLCITHTLELAAVP